MSGRGYEAVTFGWKLANFFFPCACLGCGKTGGWLCEDCVEGLERMHEPRCRRCGKELLADGSCPLCSVLREIAFDAVRSAFVYDGTIRDAIHKFKFKQKLGLSYTFANAIFSVYLNQNWQVDWVLPVPISKERLNERGYNQSAWVAKTFSLKSDLPYTVNGIWKRRNTAHQAALTESERRKNLGGAFKAEPVIVKGKSVLLIDDVLTTGTTINECARALRNAGAERVYGLTVAATRNRS